MRLFQTLIRHGDTVIDVGGGHIGYICCFFSNLVGDTGKVYVFEPGNNNLPYIEKNLISLKNTVLTKKAVSA